MISGVPQKMSEQNRFTKEILVKKDKNPEQTNRLNVFTQIKHLMKKEIGKICLEGENT